MEVGYFWLLFTAYASAWVKTDPNATTNKIASLRTDIAEKAVSYTHLTLPTSDLV